MSSFSIWHWAITIAIAILVWRVVKDMVADTKPKSATAQAANAHPDLPTGGYARIRGDGSYGVEIVGESHYRDAFVSLLGNKAGTEDELLGDAVLRLDADNPHDPLAVSVWIEGKKVGHLAREMARDFRQAIVRDGLARRTEFAVGARVYAGGEDELFSVQLDLPQS